MNRFSIRTACAASLTRLIQFERNSNKSWFLYGSILGVGLTLGCLPSSQASLPDDASVARKTAAHLHSQLARIDAPTIAPMMDATAPLPAPKPSVSYPWKEHVTLKVGKGDTLAELLEEKNIDYVQATDAINSMKKYYSARSLRVGQELEVQLEHRENETRLKGLSVDVTPLERVELTYNKTKGFTCEKKQVPVTTAVARAGGTIHSSLYETGIDVGLTPKLINELIQAYSYDVDFQRDIKPGQQLEVMFEHVVDDEGNVVGTGDILYAALKVKGDPIELFHYTDKQGDGGYFNARGESIRKALLRTPINGARISSNFGMRRHPVLGYSKMHKGMDFAAATGTPIYAAGDGVVQSASRFGSYGNYLKIRHTTEYGTAYAHLSRFAPGIRAGKRVKQGDIVAYVGTTGRSTGPHLHYEILQNGRQVNPQGVKFKTGRILQGTELANFKKQVGELKSQFASLPRVKTALASAQ